MHEDLPLPVMIHVISFSFFLSFSLFPWHPHGWTYLPCRHAARSFNSLFRHPLPLTLLVTVRRTAGPNRFDLERYSIYRLLLGPARTCRTSISQIRNRAACSHPYDAPKHLLVGTATGGNLSSCRSFSVFLDRLF